MITLILALATAALTTAHGPCTQADYNKRGCDTNNVLWQCDGTNWVIENDCGSVGYICNAVANAVSSAGCQPSPPPGKAYCADQLYGTYQCVGNSFQQCAFDPWWVELKTCAANEICVTSFNGYSGCLPIVLVGGQLGNGGSGTPPVVAATNAVVVAGVTATTAVTAATSTVAVTSSSSTTAATGTIKAAAIDAKPVDTVAAETASPGTIAIATVASLAIVGLVVAGAAILYRRKNLAARNLLG